MKDFTFAIIMVYSALVVNATINDETEEDEVEIDTNGYSMKVAGRSGKFHFLKKNVKVFTLEFDSFSEFDSSGEELTERKYTNFVRKNITKTPIVNSNKYNVSAKTFNFTTPLNNGAKLDVEMVLFTGEGMAVSPRTGDSFVVSKGSLKFSTNFRDYYYCGDGEGNCKNGAVGKYTVFCFVVKGKKTPKKLKLVFGKISKKAKRKPETYSLGDAAMTLSSLYMLNDSKTAEMEEGYPSFATKGSKQTFCVRFDKLSSGHKHSMYWDPAAGDEADLEAANKIYNTGVATISSSVHILMAFLTFMFCSKFY